MLILKPQIKKKKELKRSPLVQKQEQDKNKVTIKMFKMIIAITITKYNNLLIIQKIK